MKTLLILVAGVLLASCGSKKSGNSNGGSSGSRLAPTVSVATDLADITMNNAATFIVSGTCSEEGQPVTVSIDGFSPETAPLCTAKTWSTEIDLNRLTGPSREISITADHSSSGGQAATTASQTVTLYPRVSIADSVGNITGDTFTVNGTCSEDEQPITVDVGGINPETAPNCTNGTWSTSVDVSSLGASSEVDITADHSTSGASPLNATQASKTVTLYPRVSIAASVGNINGDTLAVNGTCSEDGQPVTVDVGGASPATAPTCTSGSWSTSVDVSGLTGASRPIAITADHSTSGASPLNATQASKTVTLYPRVSIAASVGNINGNTFTVNGTCSENSQPVTVVVGSITPSPAPTCTSGSWSVSVDVSSLGASGEIDITADHSTSGASPLNATQASKTVTLYPRVSIAASVGNINGNTFTVNGTCSENSQPVTVVVGSITPSPAPTCTSGSWSVSVDVSGLTGASRPIAITADHATSGASPLDATQASKTVNLYPRVGIAASVGNITGDTLTVNGTCSENSQPITVDVGGASPTTAPTCTSGTWSTSVDVSGLTGASRPIAITADHATSGSSPLNATQASKTVTLYPRVSIAASVGNITGDTFTVNGACSENSQPVTVVVGSITPSPAPTCTSGSWSVSVDVSGLASGEINITANHSTSGSNPLNATQASKTVTLYPRVGIAASVGNITGDTLTVNGTCSENSQPITVDVGGASPTTAPTCTSGTWSTSVDVSGLTGASRPIAITADHATSGSNPLNATQASKTVTLYPRVSIAASVGSITGDTFTVNGACSENSQPVTVVVGSITPSPAPTCTSGSWSVSVDVSGLASGEINITANHSTSGANPLNATPASKTVSLYPRVSIAASVGNITGDTFTVNGTCSEDGQPVTVDVGGVSPATAPTCTSGTWSTSVDVSSLLTGASRPITITANHSTSSSPPLNATQASRVVALAPRVTVDPNLANITPPANIVNFRVRGTCSENGQPVEVSVGGVSPAIDPTCTTETWLIDINVTSLLTGGGSRDITITANHTSSEGLGATPATSTVTLYPWVTITSSPAEITSANISNLLLSGACSENGQQVLVAVDTIAASPLPTCTNGSWSTDMDATGLGASGPIFIRAGHLSSGGLAAIQATRNLHLQPRVTIASNLESITTNNLSNFVVSGTCSENGRFVIVRVDSGISPAPPPTCTDETWTTIVDVSSLSGTPRMIDVTADHTSPIGQPALRATKSVAFNLNISIIAETITASNAANFRISGNCSENGQPVEVSVSTTISPDTDPTCTNESWEVTLDVTGLNKMGGTVNITATHSPDGGPAYPQATKSVTNSFICPENYVGIPSLAGYTTNSFCLMKYEAKNDGSDGAISQANELPYGSISRNDSIGKCMAIGDDYDLITNDEWQSLARNIESVGHNWVGGVGVVIGLSRGHSDNAPPERLAASSDDNQGCFGTGQNCSSINGRQQRRTFVLSNGEIIWDISGNIYEWVKDTNNTNYGQTSQMALVTATTHPTVGSLSGGTTNTARRAKEQFGPSGNYSHFSGSPFGGMGTGVLNFDAGAIIRGGEKSRAGLFYTNLELSGTETYSWVGFRCTYHPPYDDDL